MRPRRCGVGGPRHLGRAALSDALGGEASERLMWLRWMKVLKRDFVDLEL